MRIFNAFTEEIKAVKDIYATKLGSLRRFFDQTYISNTWSASSARTLIVDFVSTSFLGRCLFGASVNLAGHEKSNNISLLGIFPCGNIPFRFPCSG